ncbi:MAG: hypothetical protein NC548_38950 [Lachnospiraceae bacterium]|nr:hypothetical protein [Lachnospiraceae bacterium]
MLFQSLTSALKLNPKETFLNVEDIPETPTEIKAYIPKLMPKIPLGDGPVTNIKYTSDDTIFINASDCKIVATPSVVNGRNFIVVKPRDNEYPNFRSKAIYEGGRYIVKKHNQFTMEVLHEDIADIRFTGDK